MAITLRDELDAKISAGELHCEKELTMSIISGKYKVVILWHLGHDGPLRYAEIHRLFKDISDRILTKQLREMEQDCVVTRTIYAEKRVKVEYALTDLGADATVPLTALRQWVEENIERFP